jgi:hypothetical protein
MLSIEQVYSASLLCVLDRHLFWVDVELACLFIWISVLPLNVLNCFVFLFTKLQMCVMERADVMQSKRVNVMLDIIFQIAIQ